jgi:hypothetical protein
MKQQMINNIIQQLYIIYIYLFTVFVKLLQNDKFIILYCILYKYSIFLSYLSFFVKFSVTIQNLK